jgi:hypothetical protein
MLLRPGFEIFGLISILRRYFFFNILRPFEVFGPSILRRYFFFNILGPCFSGSQSSLEQTLREWKKAAAVAESVCFFEIISGTASAIDRDHLIKKDIPGCFIEFKATVHTDMAVLRALADYIGQSEPVALLVESNTGYGSRGLKNLKEVNEKLKF